MGFSEDIERRAARQRTATDVVERHVSELFDQCMQRFTQLTETSKEAAVLLLARGVPYSPDPWPQTEHAEPWPEGWVIDGIALGGVSVLTATGQLVHLQSDTGSYGIAHRPERSYFEDIKSALINRRDSALKNPDPYREPQIEVLKREAERLSTSGCDDILEALLEGTARYIARLPAGS